MRRPPRTGLFAFSPREGGSDEFAGVLGGAPRRASNSATWALSSALVAVSLATFAANSVIVAVNSATLARSSTTRALFPESSAEPRSEFASPIPHL